MPTLPPGVPVPTPPTVPAVDAPTATVVPGPTDPPLEPPFPWPSDLAVTGEVEPVCVRPGGTARLAVTTVPNAGVAYVATYAGNRGGAPPPYGEGLGGNDTGRADSGGEYDATWVVSPAAPPGPARVDVVVGWDARWGRDGIAFAVADPVTGRCED